MRVTKDSGVEWLGQIPSDWDVKPLKSLCSITNSGVWGEDPEESATGTTMPVATTAQITRDGAFIHSEMQVRSLSPLELKVGSVSKGDIVVVKSSGSADNIISGKAGYVLNTGSFCFGNFMMRLRAKSPNDSRYLYYFLTSNLTRQRIERMVSTTTYPNLKVGEYSSAMIPVPSHEEQPRIADFLDRETAKIDALIAKQEQLITTLDERRRAVISRAVTRGIVEGRPLRDSGVEWLGEIPADWDIKPLKSLCSITNSGVWGEEPEESLTGTTMPVATTAQITRDGAFLHSQMQVRSLSPLELKVGSVSEGDIVVVKSSGSADNIISGKAGYVRDTDSFCFGNFLMRLRVKASNDSRFLFYFLISNLTRQRIERMVSTTTYPNLKVGEYASAMIPVPSPKEQRVIADFLDRETGEILESTVQANRIKDLLLERRQALISAAVTGKLEVSDGYS